MLNFDSRTPTSAPAPVLMSKCRSFFGFVDLAPHSCWRSGHLDLPLIKFTVVVEVVFFSDIERVQASRSSAGARRPRVALQWSLRAPVARVLGSWHARMDPWMDLHPSWSTKDTRSSTAGRSSRAPAAALRLSLRLHLPCHGGRDGGGPGLVSQDTLPSLSLFPIASLPKY